VRREGDCSPLYSNWRTTFLASGVREHPDGFLQKNRSAALIPHGRPSHQTVLPPRLTSRTRSASELIIVSISGPMPPPLPPPQPGRPPSLARVCVCIIHVCAKSVFREVWTQTIATQPLAATSRRFPLCGLCTLSINDSTPRSQPRIFQVKSSRPTALLHLSP